MVRFTFAFIMLLSAVVFADPSSNSKNTETNNKIYWLCKNQREVRTMRVEIDSAGVCHAYYSKQGTEKSVGSGRNHDSCMNFVNNIKTNLEKSNWNCRDISSATITASLD